MLRIDNPSDLPSPGESEEIREPWLDISIIAPARYIGAVMELVTGRRGDYRELIYLDPDRVQMKFEMPLAELIVDFYDQLKSRTQGYASLDYVFKDMRASDLVKLDVLVNGQPVDALSLISHRDDAYSRGRELVESLRGLIPRQMFDVPVQASIGSRIIARETIRAMRKNVLSKCYGGDVTRKRKLLEKQKEGKARMKLVGNVEIPQEAFLAVLSLGAERRHRRYDRFILPDSGHRSRPRKSCAAYTRCSTSARCRRSNYSEDTNSPRSRRSCFRYPRDRLRRPVRERRRFRRSLPGGRGPSPQRGTVRRGRGFAVPGHPRIGERSVPLVEAGAREFGIPIDVQDAVSFLDVAAGALRVDPLAHGLQIADAEELAEITTADPFAAGRLGVDPSRPLLVAQLYNRDLASAVKIAALPGIPGRLSSDTRQSRRDSG